MQPGKALDGLHGVHVVPHAPFALEEINQNGDLQSTHESTVIGANLLMQRVWQQRPACLRPVHSCVQGDQTSMERVANVLTSLPFIALGLHAPRKNLNTKLYANSLIGVGVTSSLYHSSRGKMRKYLRWADYTMIATATVCLSRALRNENPKLLMAASALLLPVQPLMVSAVHTGMMETMSSLKLLSSMPLGILLQLSVLAPVTSFLNSIDVARIKFLTIIHPIESHVNKQTERGIKAMFVALDQHPRVHGSTQIGFLIIFF